MVNTEENCFKANRIETNSVISNKTKKVVKLKGKKKKKTINFFIEWDKFEEQNQKMKQISDQ